ncbi:unnamed protein product, partial [Medioppia subpectinata]
ELTAFRKSKNIQGRHFTAITCDSCKTFFRRNAFKENQLKCGFEGKCNITPNTRKYCQKCRLNKCFAVGMRKEIMNSDDENKRRRQLIAENKQKSKQSIQTNSVHNIPELDSNDTKISDQTVGQEVDDLIDSTFYITDIALNKQILEIENTLNKDYTNDENIIQNSLPLQLV